MSRTLQPGNTQVDETKLADLCRRYRVRDLSMGRGSCMRHESLYLTDIVEAVTAGTGHKEQPSVLERAKARWDGRRVTGPT